jgi:hypothetical protein
MLVPAPVALTPDRSFNFSDRLGRFVLANEPAILAEKHTVPLMFEGAPFQGGNVDASDFFTWQVPGVSPRRVTVLRATPATDATRRARRAVPSSRSGRASRSRRRSSPGS